MFSTDEPCGQKSTWLSRDLVQPLDVYKGQEQPAPQGPRGVKSGARRLLLPSLGLSWAGIQLSACPSFCAPGCCPSCGTVLLGGCLLSLLGLDSHCSWPWVLSLGGGGKDFLVEMDTDGGHRHTGVQSPSWTGQAPHGTPVGLRLR